MKAVNAAEENVLSLAGNFSSTCDGHLVSIDKDGRYKTQTLSIVLKENRKGTYTIISWKKLKVLCNVACLWIDLLQLWFKNHTIDFYDFCTKAGNLICPFSRGEITSIAVMTQWSVKNFWSLIQTFSGKPLKLVCIWSEFWEKVCIFGNVERQNFQHWYWNIPFIWNNIGSRLVVNLTSVGHLLGLH